MDNEPQLDPAYLCSIGCLYNEVNRYVTILLNVHICLSKGLRLVCCLCSKGQEINKLDLLTTSSLEIIRKLMNGNQYLWNTDQRGMEMYLVSHMFQ